MDRASPQANNGDTFNKRNIVKNEDVPRSDGVGSLDADAFEKSLRYYSSANVPKRKKRKKRRLGANGILRLVAFCACLGIFAFSFVEILSHSNDLAKRDEAYAKLDAYLSKPSSAIPAARSEGNLTPSLDLLAYLGSDGGGLDMLDTETKDYYESLHDVLLRLQAEYDECWGLIIVPDTTGESTVCHPLMKTTDNTKYLHKLYDGSPSSAGAIFADYRLNDDFDKNRNTVIYGHCMTDGSMFRWIKFFFDGSDRYDRAQDLEITIVTPEAVYVYSYFAGYRSEGTAFIQRFTTDPKWDDNYYYFLRQRRSLNTISKNLTYTADSKIITLITCTNLASKPGERYVLHCILDNRYEF